MTKIEVPDQFFRSEKQLVFAEPLNNYYDKEVKEILHPDKAEQSGLDTIAIKICQSGFKIPDQLKTRMKKQLGLNVNAA